MFTKGIALIPWLLGAVLLSPATAQQIGGEWRTVRSHDGAPGDYLGICADRTGDLDGDGIGDYIVGASGTTSNPGYAKAFSGATGALIHHLTPTGSTYSFGFSVAGVGDLNGDGVADLMVGAPWANSSAGYAEAYDGATGALLWHIDGVTAGDMFGYALTHLGDLNSDGLEEVAVGARETQYTGTDAGSIYVLDGSDGSTYWRFDDPSGSGMLGVSLDGGDDLDGDGFPDLIAGAARSPSFGGGLDGAAYLLSPHQNTQIGPPLSGGTTSRHFGVSVAFTGDLDGDGVSEMAVGADGFDGNNGEVFLFSGVPVAGAWSCVHVWNGDPYFGNKLASRCDLNGDGKNDILVGWYPSQNYQGEFRCYSGADYSQFLEPVLGGPNEGLGGWMAGLDDLDGDGRDEFMSGAIRTSNGRATIHSYDPYLEMSPGVVNGSTGGAVDVWIDFPASEANLRYALLASASGMGPTVLSGTEIPLTNDWLFQRMLSGNPPGPLKNAAYGRLDAFGDASGQIVIQPGVPANRLGTYYFAAVSYIPPLTVSKTSVAVVVELQ